MAGRDLQSGSAILDQTMTLSKQAPMKTITSGMPHVVTAAPW